MSPHHYFPIHFSRATSSGKQLLHILHSLRTFTESGIVRANQVCLHSFSRSAAFKYCQYCLGIISLFSPLHFTALFSEAWRDELKELAAKVNLSSEEHKSKVFLFFLQTQDQWLVKLDSDYGPTPETHHNAIFEINTAASSHLKMKVGYLTKNNKS